MALLDSRSLTRLRLQPEDAIPLFNETYCLYYNTDLIQQAGMARPPRSYDETLTYLKALANAGEAASHGASLAMPLDETHPETLYTGLLPWFYASGVDFYADGEFLFDQRSVRDVLTFLDTLAEQNLLRLCVGRDSAMTVMTNLSQGTSALGVLSSAWIDKLSLMSNFFSLTVLPVPERPAGQRRSGGTIWYAAPLPDSPHPEETPEFLTWLQTALNESTDSIAAAAKAGNAVMERRLQDIRESGEITAPLPSHLESAILHHTSAMLRQEITPAECASLVQDAATP
jgi:ABC-type glycerol-3-phosphate transport system substrate-binding protein